MKKVLFVCVENSCRSQIAEGFAKALGGAKLEAYSAGSKPSGKVNSGAVKVMQEIGIDISAAESKGFNDLTVKEFDYVITMGCRDICPFVPAKEHFDWQIDDPKGKSEEFLRKIRDLIKEKVESLIREV
ncbi:MAG: arsenate reductase ArsC [Candidatus Omnitrophica bacterium]|jgi:protein-tyrosine-phosphatase|nr:arsenate reductase ArsC [Candidatus Omnitrophota bacterium]